MLRKITNKQNIAPNLKNRNWRIVKKFTENVEFFGPEIFSKISGLSSVVTWANGRQQLQLQMFVECFWDEISSSLFYINFQQYSYLQFWDSRKFTRRTGNPSSDFQPTRFQNRSSFRRFLLFAMSIFQSTIPKSTDAVAGARRMLLAWVKQLWKKKCSKSWI